MKRRILLAMTWTLLLLIGVGLFIMAMSEARGPSPIYRSISDSSDFARACWNYREKTPGKKFPDKLSDLLVELPGRIGPFMYMRDDTCDDPWGNPYKYALVPNEKGELEPYVWAERIENGKAKLYGAKCSADGTVTQFGRPDDK